MLSEREGGGSGASVIVSSLSTGALTAGAGTSPGTAAHAFALDSSCSGHFGSKARAYHLGRKCCRICNNANNGPALT